MKYAVVAVIVIGLLVFSSVGMGETVSKGNIKSIIKPNLEWVKYFGSPYTESTSVAIDENGNIYVTGSTSITNRDLRHRHTIILNSL